MTGKRKLEVNCDLLRAGSLMCYAPVSTLKQNWRVTKPQPARNEYTVGMVFVFTSHATVPGCLVWKFYQIGVERLGKQSALKEINKMSPKLVILSIIVSFGHAKSQF